MGIFVKALRPLSLVDLKAVEAKLEARITSLRGAQRKVIRTLFYDIVAMIGTNPAIMLVKERLLHPRYYSPSPDLGISIDSKSADKGLKAVMP